MPNFKVTRAGLDASVDFPDISSAREYIERAFARLGKEWSVIQGDRVEHYTSADGSLTFIIEV